MLYNFGRTGKPVYLSVSQQTDKQVVNAVVNLLHSEGYKVFLHKPGTLYLIADIDSIEERFILIEHNEFIVGKGQYREALKTPNVNTSVIMLLPDKDNALVSKSYTVKINQNTNDWKRFGIIKAINLQSMRKIEHKSNIRLLLIGRGR